MLKKMQALRKTLHFADEAFSKQKAAIQMEYIKRSRFNVRENTFSTGAMCSPKGNKNKLARCEKQEPRT